MLEWDPSSHIWNNLNPLTPRSPVEEIWIDGTAQVSSQSSSFNLSKMKADLRRKNRKLDTLVLKTNSTACGSRIFHPERPCALSSRLNFCGMSGAKSMEGMECPLNRQKRASNWKTSRENITICTSYTLTPHYFWPLTLGRFLIWECERIDHYWNKHVSLTVSQIFSRKSCNLVLSFTILLQFWSIHVLNRQQYVAMENWKTWQPWERPKHPNHNVARLSNGISQEE